MKRCFCVCMVVISLVSLSCGLSGKKEKSSVEKVKTADVIAKADNANDEYERKLQAVEQAKIDLGNSFDVSSSGDVIYPDDYCGMDIHDFEFIVYLTSLDDDTISKYNEILNDSDVVVYKQGNLPMNTMIAYMNDLYDKLEDIGVHVYIYRVDETIDVIRIEVSQFLEEQARDYVDNLINSGMYEGLKNDYVVIEGRVPGNTDEETSSVQQEIVNINIDLMSSFEKEGMLVYPDDYCGHYINGDELHIVLTSLSGSTLEKYNEITGGSELVKYESGKISLNTLILFETAFLEKASENGLTVNDAKINEKDGTIQVFVPEDEKDETESLLNELINREWYDIIEVANVVIMTW